MNAIIIAYVIGALILGYFLYYAIIVIPKRQVRIFSGTRAERLQMENAARQTVAQIIGGLFVLLGLGFTARTVVATFGSLEIAREGQIAERFTKAVGQLGDDKNVAVRVGGIYALEKIATDDPTHYYWPVMELLTSFVRSPSPKWETTTATGGVRADFQAILTVIARRILDPSDKRVRNLDRASREEFGGELKVRLLDLREASLEGLELGTPVVLGKRGAHLKNVQLEDAHLERAHLGYATLENVYLENAHLEQSRLQEVKFVKACLIGVWLTKRHGGKRAADLRDAKLINTDLRGAHFDEDTILTRADFSGANLAWTGVTRERLTEAKARWDNSTSFTDTSDKPPSCP